ncbi:two-component system, OmpR family, KDP operon response regulator KdpE [Paenibacillus sophorae]|uniref:Response regulator transcription factor n=1 Tax=Paenibacillus sophorae TaxID=1333845 RepID=A0A1H8UT96_9BACL|nr:response regulator transcription factor [Paenibacillus sophorae]QWU15377.1 response regulator transcription factor [Paenibacillus sophorae]SEP06409.1 two-component system, OmpR family, KDP operon response regulator KdpE [Paenibacillus sophorae]
MNGKVLILVVEDEAGISTYISTVLNSNDYAVLRTDKGEEAVSLAASHHPDLMLLDLGLPDIDGIEVLRRVRQWSSMPIVVVSARGHEREKVEALDLGADDYITKPFGTSELLARIRTAIRHNRKGEGSPAQEKISIGQMSIDYEKRTVTVEGREIHFTPIEYKIITLLARHAGKVLTHDFLIREIWGPYTNENQTLRVNMANIRRKIEANPAEPKYIVTEVGVGYRMKDGDHL